MDAQISPQKIYDALKSLPDESLEKIMEYIEFIQYRRKHQSDSNVIKLGGLLAEHNIDISDDDIAEGRKEMWRKLR